VGTATGIDVANQFYQSTVGTMTGLLVESPQGWGNTITNNYGIYIQDQSGAGSSTNYNLYSAGATSKNLFAGQLTVNGSGDGTNSGVLFKNTSDSTTAFEVQNTATTPLFTADTQGMVITVAGTPSSFATLSLSNAHIKSSQTTAPTIALSTC